MSVLRIVFMGSDPIALPILEWFAQGAKNAVEVVGVFTQPDRPGGRGQAVRPSAIKAWAGRVGAPVFQPEKLREPEVEALAALKPDLTLVMAYGHILREAVIGIPRLGTVNLHASLLPKYRGASPIQTAVAAGDQQTGVSLMRIVRQLDAGPVAAYEKVAIGPLDTSAEVEARLSQACLPLLARTLPALALGTLAFTPQDDARATYCRRLTKTDGALDFSASAAELAARINGLFPWPACTLEINGALVRLGLAEAIPHVPDRPCPPGTVLAPDEQGLLVTTGSGALRLRRLQRPGGRMLPASEFLRGFRIAPGTLLPWAPMPPLVADHPF